MKDFGWLDDLWCVIKADGTFAGVPCRTAEEALELSAQHDGSGIFRMYYDWETDPFGFRFKQDDVVTEKIENNEGWVEFECGKFIYDEMAANP